MLRVIVSIVQILSPAERRRGLWLAGLMTFLAAVELAGIASIAPFLAVAANPELVDTNPVLHSIYVRLGFEDTQTFLLALAAASIAILISVAIVRTSVHYWKFRFANMRRHSVSMRLLAHYTAQPYPFFVARSSDSLAKMVLSEVDEIVKNAILPVLELLAYGLIAIAVAIFLLVLDIRLSVLVIGVLLGLIGLTYLSVRGILKRASADRANSNALRFQAAADLFGGIKELKVLGRQEVYIEAFRQPSIRYSKDNSTNDILSDIPKYLLEAIGFGAVLAISLYFMAREGGIESSLPFIALYAFAGYRVLPAMQNIVASLARIRFVGSAVDAILEDLQVDPGTESAQSGEPAVLELREQIRLSNVSYEYAGARNSGIWDIDLTIPAGSLTVIVGTTGAGKSTLTDVILGLLPPTGGKILIDGEELAPGSIRAWQNNIGYVPQHIFLANDTVARNIAFGVPDEEVDQDAIHKAAMLARIHNFVIGELPDGYDTVIGERGIGLSGGQRQRLGIARALYHDPGVIILDEATSSLDAETERRFFHGIEELAGTKTIIINTHRLGSLHAYDTLVRLEAGRIVSPKVPADV